MGTYHLLVVICLLLLARRDGHRTKLLVASGLGVLALLVYVLGFNPPVMTLLTDYYLYEETHFNRFPGTLPESSVVCLHCCFAGLDPANAGTPATGYYDVYGSGLLVYCWSGWPAPN